MGHDKPAINDSIMQIWKKDTWIPISSIVGSAAAVYGFRWYGAKFRKSSMSPGTAISWAVCSAITLACVGAKMKAIHKEGNLKLQEWRFN